MNLYRAMSVFVHIVEQGSLTRAAAVTDLSPTMVGHHLQSLEARLEVTLLNRTTRRQHLTEFGEIYYRRCLEILDLVEETEFMARASQERARGRLRITGPHSFAVDGLMPALADYGRAYPEVDIDLVISDRTMDLVEDGLEAAIRMGPIHDTELIARPLAPMRRVLCAAPAYIANHGCPDEPGELTRHDCLLYTFYTQLDAGTVNASWPLMSAEGVTYYETHGRLHVNNSAALRQAALAGMGIAMIPEPLVAEDLRTGRLVAVLPEHAPPARPLHLIYRRDRRISPKLRSFIDFIVERFGQTGPSQEPLV